MTGNLSLLCNFVGKYLGTVHFGNDQFAPILGYGELVQGNITINRVYYVEGNRGTDLYTISLQETISSNPICLMAKASPTQAWLWHRRISHLNFDYINLLSKKDVVIGLSKLKYVKDQLCSSCEVKQNMQDIKEAEYVNRLSGIFPKQTTVETVMNTTPEYRAHFESEKEAIHLILTGIRDEIYSTVDSCQTAQEMWEAIERLQQGE
ncbi:integrase [Tanacetum coccineum]